MEENIGPITSSIIKQFIILLLHADFKFNSSDPSASVLSNYRDICLGNIPFKRVSLFVRKKLAPFAHNFSRSTQFGSGFNGGETALGHLILRIFIDVCRFEHCSGSILFIDIVGRRQQQQQAKFSKEIILFIIFFFKPAHTTTKI